MKLRTLLLLLMVGLDFLFLTETHRPILASALILSLFVGTGRFTDSEIPTSRMMFFSLIAAFYFQSFWVDSYIFARGALLLFFAAELIHIPCSQRQLLIAGLSGSLFGYVLSLYDHNPLELLDSSMPSVGLVYLIVQTAIVAMGVVLWCWLILHRPLPDFFLQWRKFSLFDYGLWFVLIGGLWLLILRPVLMQKSALDSWFVGTILSAVIFVLVGLERDWQQNPLGVSRWSLRFFLVMTLLCLGMAMVFFMWFSFDETNPYYQGMQVLRGQADMYEYYGYRMSYTPGVYYYPAIGQWLTGWETIGPRLITFIFTVLTWGLLARLVQRKVGYTGAMLVLAILLTSPLLNEKMVLLKGYYFYSLTLILSLYVIETHWTPALKAASLGILALIGLFFRHSPIPILGIIPLYALLMWGWRPFFISIFVEIGVGALLLLPFSPGIFDHSLYFFANVIEGLFEQNAASTPASSSRFINFNLPLLRRDVSEFFILNPLQSLLIALSVLVTPFADFRALVKKFKSEPSLTFAALVFSLLLLSHIGFIWVVGAWEGATVVLYQTYFTILLVYLVAVWAGRWFSQHASMYPLFVFGLPFLVIFATTSTNFTGSVYGFVASHNDGQVDRAERGAACLANYVAEEDVIFYGNWDAAPLIYHPEWQVLKIPIDQYFNKTDSDLIRLYVEDAAQAGLEQMDDPTRLGYWNSALGENWLINEATLVITLDKSASYPFDERHGETWLTRQQQILDDYYELVAICQEREPLAIYRRTGNP